MHPSWKQESDLARLLESHQALRSINSAVSSGYHRFPEDDLAHLDQTITALENVQARVAQNQEYYARIGELLEFLRHLRRDLPMRTPEQVFGRLQPLIQWLFWLSPTLLRGGDADVSALAVLAQFYGVGVALDSLFSDMGIAYLGALSIGPIEDIFRIVAVRNSMDPFNAEFQLAMSLLDLPRHIVARYKERLRCVDHRNASPSSSKYRSPHGYSMTSSSSSPPSPQYGTYSSPHQSPPAVSMTTSPFEMAGSYVTVPSSHTRYPQMLQMNPEMQEPRTMPSDFSYPGAFSHSPAFQPSYMNETWNRAAHHNDATPLGLDLEVYNASQTFNAAGLVAPGLC